MLVQQGFSKFWFKLVMATWDFSYKCRDVTTGATRVGSRGGTYSNQGEQILPTIAEANIFRWLSPWTGMAEGGGGQILAADAPRVTTCPNRLFRPSAIPAEVYLMTACWLLDTAFLQQTNDNQESLMLKVEYF